VNEFVVDFLPTDLRRRGAALGARRRSMLLVSLLGLCVVGVCAHSWNSNRAAEQRRSVSLALAANSGKVDELIERLAAEQRDLAARIALSDRLALPAQASDLAATVTHLLPAQASLSLLRMEVRPERWIAVTIRGSARSNAELYDFERRLAATAPFDSVTVSENQHVDLPGMRVQQFTLTCRVPMDLRIERPTAEEATR
jgi:Tfp pilus assembly protein PilN